MAGTSNIIGGDILISIDPGYDATKVCINGLLLHIPSCTVDITGKLEDVLGPKKPGYILSNYIEGKQCLVGEQARMLLMEPEVQKIYDAKSGMLDSYEKFETQDSEVNILTAIGMALIEYEKLCNEKGILPALSLDEPINADSPLQLYVAVALPYDALDTSWKTVKKQIVGHHVFSISTYEGDHNLDFTIEKEHVMANSQVISAYLGSVSDDHGVIIPEMLDDLPIIAIDGGSKTVADMKLTKNQMVEQAASNTDFAMENIYKKVAKTINSDYGREDIRAYNIKGILDDGGQIVYEKDETTDTLDIREMVEAEKRAMCAQYIEYLNDKYNKLLDIKKIFLYGGTGAAYYTEIDEYVKNRKAHLRGKVELANYKFFGQKIDPVYAVCIGMYKQLRSSVDRKNG